MTTVCLPQPVAKLWRRRQKKILRLVGAVIAQKTRNCQARRGVKRSYNRGRGEYAILSARFSREQYDSLHATAAALRVSVSWLVYELILLWQSVRRRKFIVTRPNNYALQLHAWGENLIAFTEKIYFGPKIKLPP